MPEKSPAASEKLSKNRQQRSIAPESMDYARELLGLKLDVKGKTERSKLKEELDSQIDRNFEKFDLGQAEKKSKEIEVIQKLKPEILIGSVDSTRFAMEWHEPKWYKPFVEAAVEVENLQDLFDEPTKKWMKELEPALNVFRDLAGLDSKNYNKNVKKEIWKLVKTHGGEIIYGEKGLFNFLLAYRRIKTLHPNLGDADKEDFDVESLSNMKIKLTVGNGKGRKGGEKDRFALAASRKNKPESPVKSEKRDEFKKKEPDIGRKEEPKKKEPEKKSDDPNNMTNFPPVGSNDFFKIYKIEDPKDKETFNESVLKFEQFLKNKERGLEFLKNEKIFDKKADEDDNQHLIRLGKIFGNEDTSELFPLYNEIGPFQLKFEEFCLDKKNPDSVKYQELFFWVTKRMIDYVNYLEKNNHLSAPDAIEAQKSYHMSMLDGGKYFVDSGDKAKQKMVLEQLVASAEFMVAKSLNSDDYKAPLEEYKKKLDDFEKK